LNGENFVAYANNDLAGVNALSLQLDGRPQQITDARGNTLLVRNDNQELVIGLIALGLVMGVGVFMVRSWQQPTAVAQTAPDSQHLLQAIAELDDKFEAGELDEKAYTQERENLKEALRAIWPQTV
jgi:hypothetical protein